MATKSGSVDPSKFTEETFDLYSIPAFDRGEPEIAAGSAIGSSKQVVEPGDVLLSKIVPHIRRSWIVGKQRGRRIIASGEWIVFRSERAHPDYLRQVLVGDPFHAQFMNTVAGVGGLCCERVQRTLRRLPSPCRGWRSSGGLRRVLDRAEALRAKRRAALAQLDSLTHSLFLDLFGDPATNPKGWPIKTLGDLVAEFRYGSSNKSANQGKPALRIPNVAGGTIDLTNLKLVPVEAAEFERLRLRDGDLLFVRTNGNPDFVGRCAVFDSKAAETSGFAGDEFIFASYLIRARLAATNIASLFLREYLLGDEGRRQLRSHSKTSAGQFNINTESLGAIPVPHPPIKLQREFARRVTAVERLKTAHRASLAELDALFATLQHRAFRGEL